VLHDYVVPREQAIHDLREFVNTLREHGMGS